MFANYIIQYVLKRFKKKKKNAEKISNCHLETIGHLRVKTIRCALFIQLCAKIIVKTEQIQKKL